MGFQTPPAGFVADRRYGAADRRNSAPAASENSDDHSAVLADARAAGELAGRIAAAEEFEGEKALWTKLKLGLSRLDEQAELMLAERLRATVAALCERTLEPLALDTKLLAGRCAIAARMMGEAAGPLTLHIHPDDCDSLDLDFLKQWTVEVDPQLERGSLRFAGGEGEVTSGPAEWRAAIAAAFGAD